MKDVYVLNRNAWHSKLMKWMWNLNADDFSHLCPYFWISVLNLVLIPILLPGVMVFKVVRFIFSPIMKRIWRWQDSHYVEDRRRASSAYEAQYAQYQVFRQKLDDYEFLSHVMKNKRKYARMIKFLEMFDSNIHSRLFDSPKQRIVSLSRTGKIVGRVLIVMAALFIAFMMIWGGVVIAANFTVQGFLTFLKLLGITLGITAAVMLIGAGVGKLLHSDKGIKVLTNIGKGIAFPFVLIFQMLRDACPAIEWK